MSRRRKILILAVAVLGAAILIPVIRHYQLRAATETYIAQLKAKGEPMDLAQVIPPRVPPEKNGVPFIKNALANLKSESIVGSNPPPAMLMVACGRAMIGWQQPDIRSSDGMNQWEDLGRELAAAKGDLDSFQSLTSHPILDFNLDYQKLPYLSLNYLASLKRSAQWLSASALYDLHQGNPKDACPGVGAMLAIVKGEADERILISQLVRIAIVSMAVSPTWEILQDPDITDDDLAQLQQDWQSLEFTVPMEQTMMFGRVEHLQRFAQIRKSSEEFNKYWGYFYTTDSTPNLGADFEPLKKRSIFLRKWDELRWRWFWSYQDEADSLRAFQAVINAARMAETNQSFLSAQSFALARLKLNQNPSDDLHNYFSQSVNALQAMLRRTAIIETAQNVVITAIALKRYELQHHQLPATLDELTPDLLKAVPIDCKDGQPLRYRRNADGTFLLYSVGENGKDDGGDPSLEKGVTGSSFYWQNYRALDWVWPQPATAAEIQKYYEEQGKKSGN
jgi:hypothetical protein